MNFSFLRPGIYCTQSVGTARPPPCYDPAPESTKTIKKWLVYTSLTQNAFCSKSVFRLCIFWLYFADKFMLACKRIRVI